MPIDTQRTREYLIKFDFSSLFYEELGWDQYNHNLEVSANNQTFLLTGIAEKRGMAVFVCNPLEDGRTPDYGTRKTIEKHVAKSVHEHIIIYRNGDRTHQVWQWVRRETGRPAACREHPYHRDQPGDSLIQKLQSIAFSLEEEENLTLIDVAGRTRAAFDLDRVTKRFYDRFKKEHDEFLKFIDGIPDEELHRWYASVMLNRLMFVYFIQKKGFLGNDPDYLRNKLAENRYQGQDQFYQGLLCPLFFEGFAKKEDERSPEISQKLGKVPYLNGGIFLKHQIEENYGEQIRIPDRAFERLFDFFDQYQWHLDERPLRADNEINPDVLGYIFEKYINQKQMGAYYTKEDITEYISKNTIIPFLFDQAKQKCRIAFEGEQSVWKLLQSDPDRYIYEAVRKGVDLPLPEEIAVGLKDVSKRTEWNKSAPEEYALPTEIWREIVARRKRYEEVKAKALEGEITSINDFITYNLNMRQFAQDVIENSEGPELLRAFYHAIEKVTVLDPTCGSGAFLFAALNILEPLYEACLDRMEVFLDDLERSGEKHRTDKYGDFKKILKRIDDHPNRRYFILKSIIINNLFGVDIMEEAVEICKLRLFLKLVAQVEEAEKIEPLPDIDFNIRAGNTLVGFARLEDVRQALSSQLFSGDALKRIEEKAEEVESLFELFRQMQTERGMDSHDFSDAKEEVGKRLKALEEELNGYLAESYGVDQRKKRDYGKWLASHKPFHWFVEFYGILKKGGFDVIIGNPPYVEYRSVCNNYTVKQYNTINCGDLYALVMERAAFLIRQNGRLGMIVPVSIVSTDGFRDLRSLLIRRSSASWNLSFAERPSKLFTGVEKRLTILLTEVSASIEQHSVFSSNYRRWLSEERGALFAQIAFVKHTQSVQLVGTSIPKTFDNLELSVLQKLSGQRRLDTFFVKRSQYNVYYTRKLRYFVQFFDFIPTISDSSGKILEPSELKEIYLASNSHKNVILPLLNSNTFFWFLTVHSDVRNVNKREVETFRCSLDSMKEGIYTDLNRLGKSLMNDFRANSQNLTIDYGKHGVLTIQSFQPRLSKPVIDEIDYVLAKHYGFTDEELDFIINYDIKYRMGLHSHENIDE